MNDKYPNEIVCQRRKRGVVLAARDHPTPNEEEHFSDQRLTESCEVRLQIEQAAGVLTDELLQFGSQTIKNRTNLAARKIVSRPTRFKRTAGCIKPQKSQLTQTFNVEVGDWRKDRSGQLMG